MFICIFVFFFFFFFVCFFFQAEDGIRDTSVTGVQTCALPIYTASGLVVSVTEPSVASGELPSGAVGVLVEASLGTPVAVVPPSVAALNRSEERRVGKGCRSRWSPDH